MKYVNRIMAGIPTKLSSIPTHRLNAYRIIMLVCLYAGLNAGCSGPRNLGGAGNLLSLLGAKPELSTLLSLVNSAGLGNLLSGKNPLTLLAPTNAAFQALPAGVLSSLTQPGNKDKLTSVLTNHLIPGSLDASALAGKGNLQNQLGNMLAVSGGGDDLRINGARVEESVQGQRGFVHLIDRVLIPE
jgi:uncharacterized surface protein with fasciclin (FAS1) repeats